MIGREYRTVDVCAQVEAGLQYARKTARNRYECLQEPVTLKQNGERYHTTFERRHVQVDRGSSQVREGDALQYAGYADL